MVLPFWLNPKLTDCVVHTAYRAPQSLLSFHGHTRACHRIFPIHTFHQICVPRIDVVAMTNDASFPLYSRPFREAQKFVLIGQPLKAVRSPACVTTSSAELFNFFLDHHLPLVLTPLGTFDPCPQAYPSMRPDYSITFAS